MEIHAINLNWSINDLAFKRKRNEEGDTEAIEACCKQLKSRKSESKEASSPMSLSSSGCSYETLLDEVPLSGEEIELDQTTS